jgi:hypothetical protein
VIETVAGLMLLIIIFRVTRRKPTTERQQRPFEPASVSASAEEIEHARILGLSGRVTFEEIKRCYRERSRNIIQTK